MIKHSRRAESTQAKHHPIATIPQRRGLWGAHLIDIKRMKGTAHDLGWGRRGHRAWGSLAALSLVRIRAADAFWQELA